MGSNLIVIGTLIFLFISAVLLVLMTYSMSKKVEFRVLWKFFKVEFVIDNRHEKPSKNKKRKDDGGAENASQQTD